MNATPEMSLRDLVKSGSSEAAGKRNVDKPTRLGRTDLGWFAHEQQMPTRLIKAHQIGPVEHGVAGVVKMLNKLCQEDACIDTAYFCHPAVQYIGRLRWEGSFCGYRNIQMLISYISGAKAPGSQHFIDGIPSILKIQDLIEQAWDKGINGEARIETGGIRGSRKHIGTPEAQALFKSLGIGCRVATYHNIPNGPGAFDQLLLFTKEYFLTPSVNTGMGIHQTSLPPIYLQRPRHSLTIVGYTGTKDSARLIVFDPATSPSAEMRSAAEHGNGESAEKRGKRAMPGSYVLGKKQLAGYKNFETLILIDIVT